MASIERILYLTNNNNRRQQPRYPREQKYDWLVFTPIGVLENLQYHYRLGN